MRRFYSSILICLFPFLGIAQSDYILIDSTLHVGVSMINQGTNENSRSCVLQKKNGETIRYSPDQVKEYGLKNGNKYISFTIQENGQAKTSFFQVFRSPYITLYYLPSNQNSSHFFYADQGTDSIIALPNDRKVFQEMMKKSISGNPDAQKNTTYLHLKKGNIGAFMEYLDKNETFYFPHASFGIMSGYKSTVVSMVANAEKFTKNLRINTKSIPLGIFADFPINRGRVSVHPEVWFSTLHVSQDFEYNGIAYLLKGDYSYFSFPLLIRYTRTKKHTSPYFQFGPVLSVTGKDKTQITSANISATYNNRDMLKKNMAGFNVGTGIVFHRRKAISFGAEVRYSRLYNLKRNYQFNNFQEFATGLNIFI